MSLGMSDSRKSEQVGVFRQTARCVNSKDSDLKVYVSTYSYSNSRERFISSVSKRAPDIEFRNAIIWRFEGDGSHAILPETRVQVNIEELFKGNLIGNINIGPLPRDYSASHCMSGDVTHTIYNIITRNAIQPFVGSFENKTFSDQYQ